MNFLGCITASAAVLAAAACTTPIDAPQSPTLGEAVATLDKQIIAPAKVTDAPPESSAARAAEAIKRYERDEPRRPDVYATSHVSSTSVSSASESVGP